MILSNSLLKDALKEFNEKKTLPFIIEKSMPVLFFGDLKGYMENDYKVITAAINPSDMEFKNKKEDKFYSSKIRFKDFDGSAESIELACSNYFRVKPYEWFGKKNNKHYDRGFKPILNGMGYCYYPNRDNLKSVLHTDICSPLATKKKWSDLTPEEKNKLMDNGFQLWKKLVLEIKPNVILMSIEMKQIHRLNPSYIKTIHVKNDRFKINLYSLNLEGFSTYLVWGNAQNTPFQPFKNKFQLGELIKKTLTDSLK